MLQKKSPLKKYFQTETLEVKIVKTRTSPELAT